MTRMSVSNLSDPRTDYRFWSKVRQDGDCWIWTAGTTRGYGHFNAELDGVWFSIRAHRYAYERMVGEIPSGLVLDHLCRNTACVNPYHLDPVTQKVNVRRGALTLAYCLNGHEMNDPNLYVYPSGKRECRACRRQRDIAQRPFRFAKKEVSA